MTSELNNSELEVLWKGRLLTDSSADVTAAVNITLEKLSTKVLKYA